MRSLPPPTAIERIAGSLPLEIAGSIIGAMHGGVIAPLLPVLTNSLAARRQQLRVELFLKEVNADLERNQAQLSCLTDGQYKIINEAVAAAFQTTHEDKLKLLQYAISNTFSIADASPHEATFLSRLLRDISTEEAVFVVNNFKYLFVHISSNSVQSDDTLTIIPESRESEIVGSLAALGVLTVGEPTYGQQLRFSPYTAKLIVLLRGDA